MLRPTHAPKVGEFRDLNVDPLVKGTGEAVTMIYFYFGVFGDETVRPVGLKPEARRAHEWVGKVWYGKCRFI